MKQDKLYLIKHNNKSWSVRSNNALEAVTKWFETVSEERKQEGTLVEFNPLHFSVEAIDRVI